MTTTLTAATRVSYALNELNFQASSDAIIKFENGNAFYLQGDGNIVYYEPKGVPVWAAGSNVGTGDQSKLILRFQDDGNLTLYHDGKATWHTDTANVGKKLVISDARPYLTILDAKGNIAWYSKQQK